MTNLAPLKNSDVYLLNARVQASLSYEALKIGNSSEHEKRLTNQRFYLDKHVKSLELEKD